MSAEKDAGTGKQDELWTFKNMGEENRARDMLFSRFRESYQGFFYPGNEQDRIRAESRILTCQDFTSGDGFSVVYNYYNLRFSLPYSGLDSIFVSAFQKDRDPSFTKPLKQNRRGIFPNVAGALSPRVAHFANDEMFLERNAYVLIPDGDIQRGVDRYRMFFDKDREAVGEIWLGRKWKNTGVSNGSANNTETTLIRI